MSWLDRTPITADDPLCHAVERTVRAYVAFGWQVVRRQPCPSRVWLTYVTRQRTATGLETHVHDRIIWVGEDGEIRVEEG